jgi:uncharacterized protein (TIGR02452 family)
MPRQERAIKEFNDTFKRSRNLLTFVVNEEHKALSNHTPKIRLLEGDMIAAAHELASQGKKVALLNFASERRPGGGVQKGACAQEEQLCVRTELYKALETQLSLYETKSMHDVLVCHDVRILKDHNFELVTPETITVITAAAPRWPKTTGRVITDSRVLTQIGVKMRKILRAACGCDVLILGAWGCGAFRCPPQHMAELMFCELKQVDYEVHFVVKDNPDFLEKLKTLVPA